MITKLEIEQYYSKAAIIDYMCDWFTSNYEDPAENTPFESAEGGYQYIWGGPVDTRETLDGEFMHLFAEDLIQAAAIKLENEYNAIEWVPVPCEEDENVAGC